LGRGHPAETERPELARRHSRDGPERRTAVRGRHAEARHRAVGRRACKLRRREEARSLRIDASSKRAFERSLGAFKDELSPERRQAFGDALTDIWLAGEQAAEGQGRKYRTKDYYRQIDGLGYDEVVSQATGEAAKQRDRQLSAATSEHSPPRAGRSRSQNERPSPWAGAQPSAPPREPGPNWRGGINETGPGLQQ
jgi:hypothetical protein